MYSAIIFLGICILVSCYLISKSITEIANREYVHTQNISDAISYVGQVMQKEQTMPNGAEIQGTMYWSETVKYLGVNGQELEILIKETDIPYLLFNQKYIFQKEAIDQWLKNSGQKRYQIK